MRRASLTVAAALIAASGFAGVGDAQTRQSHTRLTVAATPGAPPLSCQANKLITCGSSGCEVEEHPSGLPVHIDLKTATGRGYLCTYTYCRSFTLMGWRDRARGVGLTWSSASGSTPPYDKTPTYDYILTVADDAKSFSLISAGNGGFGGYSGACGPPTP